MSIHQSPLTLWYYRWSPTFHPSLGKIILMPDSDVDSCKQEILKRSTPRDNIHLYSPPMDIPILGLKSSLGQLSLSKLSEPLPVCETIGGIIGPEFKAKHLHLILVDHDIPLIVVCCTSPSNQFRLQMSRDEPVESLLCEIKKKVFPGVDNPDLDLYKSSFDSSMRLGDEEEQPLTDMAISVDMVFNDIPFSRFPGVIIRTRERKRAHPLDWDVNERANKLQKTVPPPSSMTVSAYNRDQRAPDTRWFDYRVSCVDTGRLREEGLPPIEVLFEGFGEFLDTWRGPHTFGHTQVDMTQVMQRNIDDFVISMSQTFTNEEARHMTGLAALNAIFGSIFGDCNMIVPSDLPSATATGHPPRSDGHYVYGSSRIPCFIIEFKNEESTNAIPVVEMATYYKHMVGYVGLCAPEALRRSRLPSLGMTIAGPAITFFALAYVGSVVYVPLTTSLWCLPIECGGSDRHLLYIAFSAASTLLARIETDAKALSTGPPPRVIKKAYLPQICKLSSHHEHGPTLQFEITEIISKTLGQHVYKAVFPSGRPLIIKLARSYSRELHQICAELGCAPELYAAQKLPGNFEAIAMEYLTGVALDSPQAHITVACRDKWITGLEELVAKFHADGYVHGDLRLANLFRVGDRIMLLDFDWGGKAGKASYPHRNLNPELTRGRNMAKLEITKEDDDRVLAVTLDRIRRLVPELQG